MSFFSILGNSDNDQELPDNQKISMYEVALGTDRRFSYTRTNIVPFTDVGNRTSYTFEGLDLVPGTSKYYCTVKAYSTSLSTAQSMSNGFFVTFNGGVTGMKVTMNLTVFRMYVMKRKKHDMKSVKHYNLLKSQIYAYYIIFMFTSLLYIHV